MQTKIEQLERELIAAQQTIHELQHGKYGTLHLGERIRTLEAEKITTAQSLAQKDGEIQRLREALKPFAMMYREEATCGVDYVVATRGYASDMTMITEADIHKAAHAFSTPPSAVVPKSISLETAEALADLLSVLLPCNETTTLARVTLQEADIKAMREALSRFNAEKGGQG